MIHPAPPTDPVQRRSLAVMRISWGGGVAICLASAILIGGGLWWWESRLVWGVEREERAWLPDATKGTWGFRLEPLLVPLEQLQPGPWRKDDAPSITNPDVIPADQVTDFHPASEVVGISLNGRSRAYPINLLAAHRCINDTLGGEPIAVVHSPLSGVTMAFSRKIGAETREFGLSGLIHGAGVLLYDRQADPYAESLWFPITGRALSGPAARDRLRFEPIDAEYTRWEAWRQDHPDTTIVPVGLGYDFNYKRFGNDPYLRHDGVPYKVPHEAKQIEEMEETDAVGRRPELNFKDRVMMLWVDGKPRAYALTDLAQTLDNSIEEVVNGMHLRISLNSRSGGVAVRQLAPDGGPVKQPARIRRAYAFWFAYDAAYPEGEIHEPKMVWSQ